MTTLQTFVFLFRDTEQPRRIPTRLWRDVMAGRIALPGVEDRNVQVVEIDVVENNGQPLEAQRVEGWQLQFNEFALLDRTEWQEKAMAAIQPFLSDVFSREYRHNDAFWLSDSLSRLYEKVPGDAQHWQPSEDQMAQVIAQIWR
jgi:hypothetical protein